MTVWVFGTVALASLAVGCDSGESASPASGSFARSVASTSTGAPTTTATTATTAPDAPAPTVPMPTADAGVPGLDSADAFCRSWSRFAGSFQALALASARATDPATASRAEVAASAAILDAVAQLGDHLPAELEPERATFVNGLLAGLQQRALRAEQALRAVGFTDQQLQVLGDGWLDTLTATGPGDPDINVVLPPSLDPRLDAQLDVAAAAFAAAVPTIGNDPSLVSDASTPLTLAFLATNCPDQGTLGGNDIVDLP